MPGAHPRQTLAIAVVVDVVVALVQSVGKVATTIGRVVVESNPHCWLLEISIQFVHREESVLK